MVSSVLVTTHVMDLYVKAISFHGTQTMRLVEPITRTPQLERSQLLKNLSSEGVAILPFILVFGPLKKIWRFAHGTQEDRHTCRQWVTR